MLVDPEDDSLVAIPPGKPRTVNRPQTDGQPAVSGRTFTERAEQNVQQRMGESYYELLGVPEDANTDEIERAYREKLKETHPDVSDNEDASERTKRLIDAKETLTDEHERSRYDRLGHETYVGTDTAEPATPGTEPGGSTGKTGKEETTDESRHGRQRTSNRRQANNRRNRTSAGQTPSGETSTENVGSGAAWAQTTDRRERRTRASPETNSSWRVWSTDRAYAVERGVDALRFGGIFSNQRALVLLGTTFLVYPVLLFGALTPGFPLAINLLVAACVVFVIAFLQSVPEVGMVVFGGWTLLLPPVLFLGFGLSIISLQGILALTAVVFPFGLSALTRVAIRPVTAG